MEISVSMRRFKGAVTDFDGSAAEVDQADSGYGLAEEVGAEALEFFYGVRGIEGASGFGGGGEVGEVFGDEGGGSLGGGFGGVDDVKGMVEGLEGAADGRLDEWVVGAAEEEGFGVGVGCEGFG